MKKHIDPPHLLPRLKDLNHSLHAWWETLFARLRYHPEKRYFRGGRSNLGR